MIYIVAPVGLMICFLGDAPWWGYMIWLWLVMLSADRD